MSFPKIINYDYNYQLYTIKHEELFLLFQVQSRIKNEFVIKSESYKYTLRYLVLCGVWYGLWPLVQ